mgnify:CR=1 FL=1
MTLPVVTQETAEMFDAAADEKSEGSHNLMDWLNIISAENPVVADAMATTVSENFSKDLQPSVLCAMAATYMLLDAQATLDALKK